MPSSGRVAAHTGGTLSKALRLVHDDMDQPVLTL